MKKIGIIIFIAALIIGITLANLFSFGRTTAKLFSFSVCGVEGSGNLQVDKRNVADFRAVSVSGAFHVEITARKDFSVEVEAEDNLLEFIKTEVSGETLEISMLKRISTRQPIRIRIGAPDIENIDVSGASKLSLVDVRNDSLRVDSSGASKIKIEGETKNLWVDLSGASRFDAGNLKSENAVIGASGASSADVFVSNDLKADLSGACRLSYAGNPRNLEKRTSGASSIVGR